MTSKRKQTTLFKCSFKEKVSHRGTVTEVSGKEFIEESSQEKGFFINEKDAKIASKVKQGLNMHKSWCKKLKQCNDTNKQTKNVSSSSNVGNETNKANTQSESKIMVEVIADRDRCF